MSLVLEGKPYLNFINSLKSDFTKQTYTYHLKRFMTSSRLTLQAFLKLSVPEIEQLLIEYIMKLKTEGLSPMYINVSLATMKHLCVMNDVIINHKKIAKFIGEQSKVNEDRAYTHEEIRRLLNVCDLRMKMVVLLLASTGMRVGALPALKLGHLNNATSCRVTAYAGTKHKYTSFYTPECKAGIDAYLQYRERSGEELTPDSPLIREQFDINDFEQIRKRCKPIARGTLINLLHHALIRSGLRTVNHSYSGKERFPVNLAHGFRKFFTTQLINSKVNPEIREMLLGHSIGLASAYYKPTEDEMLDEYMKAVDNLTINEENRLKRKVQKLEVEKSQIEALALELEKVKKAIKKK